MRLKNNLKKKMEKSELNNWKEIGRLAAETRNYAKSIVKEGMPLVDIAEKVEEYIRKKKVGNAFPISLSIKDVAAHYTPIESDGLVAEGLLKIDLGLEKDGFLSDNAVSIDLTPENKFKDLIKASEDALKAAIKKMKLGEEIRNVGKEINNVISTQGFEPIRNLSGHNIKKMNLHAGINIPNYDNKSTQKLTEGIYAVEPFATTGEGLVKEGKPSNVFMIAKDKPTRLSRDVLKFIKEEYKTLPFSSRWITNKFGKQASISLQRLTKEGILHHFSQLINEPGKFTTQTEHSLAVLEGKTIILTE